jgi:zinc protease
MGFLEDIEDMPNQFDYSLEFYRRYYRPEYTTILLVGDLTRDRARDLTRKYFGEWQRGSHAPQIPAEPPQTEPRTTHIDWPSPTLPYVVVAFHGPAYSDEKVDKAALDLLAVIAFGENSELYQRLVLKEQKVDVLSAAFDDQMDPELFSVVARIKELKDVDYVRDQIAAAFRRFTTDLIPDAKLNDTRAHLRYGTALTWTSSGAVASFLAPYVALRRTPDTVDKLFSLYDRVTPESMRELASRYFTENSRTIVTLATKSSAKEGAKQ